MAGVNVQLSQLLDAQDEVMTATQALRYFSRRGLEAHLKHVVLQKFWYGIYGLDELNTGLQLRGLDLAAGRTVTVCMGTVAAAYGFDTERTGHRGIVAARELLD